MRTLTTTLLCVSLLGPAWAGAPTPDLAKAKPVPAKAPAGKDQAQSAPKRPARPLVERGAQSQFTPMAPAEQLVKVHKVIDGTVLVSISLPPTELANMKRLGFREVLTSGAIGDRTIFRGELYRYYPLALDGPTGDELESYLGQKVHLTTHQRVPGTPEIVKVAK